MCEDERVSAKIVRLTDSQIPAAAATLARAFHDDPLMVYAIPGAVERTRLLPEMYARMIRFGTLAGEVYVTAGALDGVALWLPPNAKWTRENIEASGMHETRESDRQRRISALSRSRWPRVAGARARRARLLLVPVPARR